MKVVLTHSYFLEEDPVEKQVMKPYPPLGMLYVAAYLREHGFPNEVFDSTFSSQAKWESFMLETQPEVLFFYVNMITKPRCLALIQFVKHNLPNTIVVGGGPDATYNAEAYLKHGFDYLVIGEGEETAFELLKALQHGDKIDDVPGLAFLQDKKCARTAERQKMKQLQELPIPAREAIDFEQYLQAWKHHHGIRMASISTQRGCPYTCNWCSTAVYGQSYRRRPAEQVFEELLQLQDQFDVEGVWFVDDVFTVSHKWLAELHGIFVRHAFSIPFECITRAERLNEEILDMLKEMGCFRIWIGAESGSQEIIDRMDRRVSVEQVRHMINLTKAKGMQAGTFIMLGYPGEGLKEIKETVNHIKEATPSQLTATVAYPIKGTKLFDEVEDSLLNQGDWAIQTDRQLDFSRRHPRKFYAYAMRYVLNKHRQYVSRSTQAFTYALKAKVLYLLMLLNR